MLRVAAEIDSHEFKSLFDQWHRKVYDYALSKTKSTYIAEETVQRVFIKLWYNLHKVNPPIPFEAQLFCVTKTVMIDILREENRRAHHRHDLPDATIAEGTPFDQYQLKEMQQRLDVYVDTMPTVRREVFRLSRYEQLSYHEIAQKLDIKIKTVENHINLALKYLRRLMYKFPLHIFFILHFLWG